MRRRYLSLSIYHFIFIFINNLPDISSNYRFHLYVDDTMISVSGLSTNDLQHKLIHHAKLVSEWMNINQLTVNMGKTVIMTFGISPTLKKVSDNNYGQ